MPWKSQRAPPNPPEFAQPRLSRVKRQSSPARGYKFGWVCSYMPGHEDAGAMTGHMGTNTPKFAPPLPSLSVDTLAAPLQIGTLNILKKRKKGQGTQRLQNVFCTAQQ